MCSSDIFLGVLAILFPPIAVWVKTGLCSADSLINILLCMLGYLPGLLHAWYIIAKFPENAYEYVPDSEARVTYVVVPPSNHPQPQAGSRKPAAGVGGNQGYGTTAPPAQQSAENGTWSAGGQGSAGGSGAVPPSYEQAIRGDHKVQTRD